MNKYVDINKKTYDEVATDLAKRHEILRVNEPTPRDYYEKISKYIKKENNLKYLELGPGDGIVLKEFANNLYDTTAIEISEKMIEIAKNNSKDTKYINKDIKDVELDEKGFDVIFAGSFVHLFPKEDLQIVMDKIKYWLDDEGIFFLYTTMHDIDEEGYFKKDKLNYKKENIRFRHRYTFESLEELLKANNFNILEHYTIDEPENDRIWQFCICNKMKG